MNGVLVNDEKISGSKEIFPGDMIQFELKGPKFKFDLDPRPPDWINMPFVSRQS